MEVNRSELKKIKQNQINLHEKMFSRNVVSFHTNIYDETIYWWHQYDTNWMVWCRSPYLFISLYWCIVLFDSLLYTCRYFAMLYLFLVLSSTYITRISVILFQFEIGMYTGTLWCLIPISSGLALIRTIQLLSIKLNFIIYFV